MTDLAERIAELERITRTMTPRDAVPILMAHIAGEAERTARAVADDITDALSSELDHGFACETYREMVSAADIAVPEPQDWEDLRGIAPNATGDLSSEDFIRKQRDEWTADIVAPETEGSDG